MSAARIRAVKNPVTTELLLRNTRKKERQRTKYTESRYLVRTMREISSCAVV